MDLSFTDDMKFNCDLSDAKFWGYFSVCGLLMRYRDLYRSEKGLKPWAEINRSEIGEWIENKEARWPELERQDFKHLQIGHTVYSPFDVAAINKALEGRGLIYGAGYGMYLKPTFFLAELRDVREIDGLTVYTSGRELVRDLFTAPGMLQERTIFLRLEPLTMLLLYKHAELNVRRVTSLEDAFAGYGIPQRGLIDDTFVSKLEGMAKRFAEILLAHELAEASEERPEWKDILALAEGDRQVEHYLRAVQDLVADTSARGPYKKIIETQDRGALSMSISLIDGYRKVLFPVIKEAYAALMLHHEWSVIEEAREQGFERFRAIRDEIVRLYRTQNSAEDFIRRIKGLIPKD